MHQTRPQLKPVRVEVSASSAPEASRRVANDYSRHSNKPVDLSRTIRLSGLSSGAKLELVQSSRSPSVVSIALQLPESEAAGVPNARLTDKFPSNTTLWLVLRKFEAGVAGGVSTKRNLTARGAPATNEGLSGRMYYQTPVLQAMGRELSSFTDLQKTLGQLGFNSGNVLLRLSFRTTDTPLEEAMGQIEDYFKSTEPDVKQGLQKVLDAEISSDTSMPDVQPKSSETIESPSQPAGIEPVPSSETDPAASTEVSSSTTATKPAAEPTITSSSGRTLQVFAPPTSTTPTAALTSYNPADYTPTIEHAQRHQRMLSESTQNRRLPSEAEIAAKATEQQEQLAAVKDVEIKIRFPDESSISTRFTQTDTGAALHKSVRECLDERWLGEAFVLKQPGIRGKGEVVPDDERKRLIRDLGLKGRVLVIFGWDEKSASLAARSEKMVLKASLRQQARPLQVQDFKNEDLDDEPGIKITPLKEQRGDDEDKGKRKGMPKWLKGLSKK